MNIVAGVVAWFAACGVIVAFLNRAANKRACEHAACKEHERVHLTNIWPPPRIDLAGFEALEQTARDHEAQHDQ